jgi:hypothetical protein
VSATEFLWPAGNVPKLTAGAAITIAGRAQDQKKVLPRIRPSRKAAHVWHGFEIDTGGRGSRWRARSAIHSALAGASQPGAWAQSHPARHSCRLA